MIYSWGDERRFNSYSGYFKKLFGSRIQKVTVNAGFTCPNRDGKISFGSCSFCNNEAFTPSYCMKGEDIGWQIKEGIEFHRKRYRNAEKYLAYFQSFSNTYAPLDILKSIYEPVMAREEIAGIIIGTRPDCINDSKLDYFQSLARHKYISIEYGIESCYDQTLQAVNRGHDFRCAREAVKATTERGLHCGAHFILGLPGETDKMLLDQVNMINSLGLTTVKFHQLQIFRGTDMALRYEREPEVFRFWDLDAYIDLFIEILRRLDPSVVVERFASEAPPRFHAGPNWGLIRNEQLLAMLEKRLQEINTYQGELFRQ